MEPDPKKHQYTDLGPKKHYYQDLEDRFDEVWESATSTFKLNKGINIVVVIIGVTLIAYGLIFQWVDTFIYHPTSSKSADDQTIVTSASSNTTNDQENATSANSNTTDDQANVMNADTNNGNQPTIPNLTGLISSGTGLATIVGLFFFKSQAHIQRAFTNLAITNFISTANMWGFKRLDWYMWAKYKVPTLKVDDPERVKAGNVSSVKEIPFDEYAALLDKMQLLTKEYSGQLYKKTRLMEDLIQEEKAKKKDDKGEGDNKTGTTSEGKKDE